MISFVGRDLNKGGLRSNLTRSSFIVLFPIVDHGFQPVWG